MNVDMKKRLNFLFLFPDQHRGDWMPYRKDVLEKMGMEKLPLRMPNIEKLMSEGVTFANAVTSSPLCAPARACLASGLRYMRCRVASNRDNYPVDQKTYYSVLGEAGYSVGAVGKLDVHKEALYWGLDGWVPDLGKMGFTHAIDNEGKWDAITSVITERSEDGQRKRIKPADYKPKGPYMRYLSDKGLMMAHINDFMKRALSRERNETNFLNTDPTDLPEESYCDNWLTGNGIEMLRSFPEDRPWHLVVNFTGPHDPWDVTKRMKKLWENTPFPNPNQGNNRTADEEIKIRQNYAAVLENIDRNAGLLIDVVRKRGELDNTIIIYSSDHGEMLGDFGRYAKVVPQRGSVKIPLVISGPGIKKEISSDALIELQDLTATIIDYAGATMKEAEDAISLRHLLEGEDEVHRDYQISALDMSREGRVPWRMITDGKYKLIVESNDNISLYCLEDDPWENNDIAGVHPEVVSQLLEKLAAA